MKKTNPYEQAIKLGRTVDFLLGRREFLYEDDTFSKELHTPYLTFMDIQDYGKKYGEIKMLKRFEIDIKKVLKKDLNPNDFFTISQYIFIYMLCFYEEKDLEIEWIPDRKTKRLIRKHYYNFYEQFDPKDNFNYKFPIESNGFFLANIIKKFKFIKERFGVDLLIEDQNEYKENWLSRLFNSYKLKF
ncbi:hypothetical protein [Flavobacterium sp. ASV13]|uniref:hypothetical protein n=1 Tax=Flavobacterium sp. ASV13 TaxID=1506583 RepID=UPI0005510D8F|nr:hypothetical protein [Flavobacterium sp. ASV13]